jgi:hypothetical protein
MTADEWAGEEYQRNRRGWSCPTVLGAGVVLLVLAVTSFRLAAIVVDRAVSR